MGKSRRSFKRSLARNIFTQNCRGLKTEAKLTELIEASHHKDAFAVCAQETWRCGKEISSENGWTFLGVGPDEQHGRGSRGVRILLSPAGTAAWKHAESNVWCESDRVIATRLMVLDAFDRRKRLGVFIISGYAPTSADSEAEGTAYYAAFGRAMSHMRTGDVLVAGVDANASVGKGFRLGQGDSYSAVGPFGLDHVNDSGRRFRTFLETHGLVTICSFYHKTYYGTWLHPCSKRGHQLDHIVVQRLDIKRFRDAGACCGQLIDSDHRAVGCKLHIALGLEKKSICRRDELSKLDFSTLRCVKKQDAFVRAVQRVIAAPLSSQDSQMPQNSYSVVASAIKIASHKILPLKSKPQPDWFEAKKSELLSIISARNAALDSHHRRPSLETAERWRTVRKKLKTALRAAKSDWILGKCKGLNDSITSTHGTKTSWDTVKELRDGLLGRSRRLPPAKMKLADGSLGKTAEENATVFATHFETLYGIDSPHDESVVELLRQRDVAEGPDHPPTPMEVRAALGKLRNTSPGESGIPALAWKALGLTDESLSLVMAFVIDFWEAEEYSINR